MNIALWIAAVLVALLFVMAGTNKVIKNREDLATMLPWTAQYPLGFTRFIGIAELLGAIGLIAPQATGIAPILTPIAAIGLAIIMALAVVFHIKRGESKAIGMNLIILALSLFVAIGRLAG